MTSKLQVTLPKALASQYGIAPGDEIAWEAAGEVIRVVPARAAPESKEREAHLRLFDAATRRQRKRDAARPEAPNRQAPPSGRGWTRDELYRRGHSG